MFCVGGGGQNTVNDGFAKLSESLYVAEKKAREEIEASAKLRVAVSRKHKEQQELEFRSMAAAARDKRTVGGREAEEYARVPEWPSIVTTLLTLVCLFIIPPTPPQRAADVARH